MERGRRRVDVFGFVKKAYEMVDDHSTDSIVSWGPDGSSFIVWKPLECKRDLLTKHLQIYNFTKFKAYGFREIASGEEHLEFACNDFVRGKPELLGKIAERHAARIQALRDQRQPLRDRLKNCKTREEWELASKEWMEMREKDFREKVEAYELAMAIERLRAKRLEDQMHHVSTAMAAPFFSTLFQPYVYQVVLVLPFRFNLVQFSLLRSLITTVVSQMLICYRLKRRIGFFYSEKGDWRGISSDTYSSLMKYLEDTSTSSDYPSIKRRSSLFDMIPDEVADVLMESHELQAENINPAETQMPLLILETEECESMNSTNSSAEEPPSVTASDSYRQEDTTQPQLQSTGSFPVLYPPYFSPFYSFPFPIWPAGYVSEPTRDCQQK
ncbi:unnamed protein product [Arabis nemorensis]|uniref:HSF-type DNA-binding domain-containing protein n=1 Tax=Arabis nemorensis TaxID=586526 RepID=A0A565CFJ4_9BRAS|nr:unnamed protein product [Arabis nemorensis]